MSFKMNQFFEKTDLESFKNINKCLEETSILQKTDIISTLKELDSTKEFKGIRLWYGKLAEKYYRTSLVGDFDDLKNKKHRKEAEDNLTYFPIIVTGARSGDVIIGTKTQAKNAILKISKNIPPKTQELNLIRGYSDLWERFLIKLGMINFFSDTVKINKNCCKSKVSITPLISYYILVFYTKIFRYTLSLFN